MKKLMLYFLIAASSAHSQENVNIHGKIIHPLSDSVAFSYSLTSAIYEPVKKIARLDNNGNFHIRFTVPEGFTKIEIQNGEEGSEIFVQPGTDLTMTVDARHFDSTLHYKGNGEDLANFMARHVLERHSMLQFNMQGMMMCGKEPAAFEQAFDSLEKSENDFLNANGQNLPQAFKSFYTTYYRYMKYEVMEIYPRQHEMIKQQTNQVKDIPVQDYVVIDHIPEAFNDDYINNPGYQAYLTNFFSLKLAADNARKGALPAKMSTDTLLQMAYIKMPPKTAEYYAGQALAFSIKYLTEEDFEKYYRDYKAHFPKSTNLERLRHVADIKKTVAIGKQAFDFDITTPEGQKMKLSDMRGKVVYLDFWSSWCAPCLGEMPDAKKIHAYFKDKPVAFINVSLDTKDESWRQAIKKYDVDGINTLEDKGFESELAKRYGVKGIPSYFLIDKNGKFARIEDLARPSDGEKLKKQIEILLN